MAESKSGKKLAKFILFGYLILFPMGKLARWGLSFDDWYFKPDLTDILALLAIPVFYISRFKKPAISKFISEFLMIAFVSLLISATFLPYLRVIAGSLFFLRLLAYVYLFYISWNLVNGGYVTREKLIKYLLYSSLFTAILGWLQYLAVPDMTSLKFFGWDDHLYRLTGTFLDPTFTSILLVFAALISLTEYLYKKSISLILLMVVFIVTVVFTYTRASFLALAIGLLAVFLYHKKKALKLVIVAFGMFILSVLFLPRMASEGTLLERTNSLYAKRANYIETLKIVKTYPVFGVGYNNMCYIRLTTYGGDPTSHSCSGSDSSLLLVLATTGIVGFLIFANMVLGIFRGLDKNRFSLAFVACSSALFVHSFFVQSAFYTFVMGFMGILLAVSLKDQG